MRKDKSAGAFGTWIEGIVSVRAIIDDKMVDLQEMQAKANANAKEFNARKDNLVEFQNELKKQGESLNAKSAAIYALKEEMARIGKIQFGEQ